MKRRLNSPRRNTRAPKPIAPNPWRRGRRRSRHQDGADQAAGAATADRPDNCDARMVVGLFRDGENAERAYRSVSERGYGRESVNMVITDETCKLQFPGEPATGETETRPAEGAGIGAGIGGTIGGLAGSLAAAGASVAVPGLGVLIAGPIAATLAGIGAGGLAGGLIGALIGSGVPEEHVAEYESAVNNGGILLSVKPRSAADAEHFEKEWKAHNADHVRR